MAASPLQDELTRAAQATAAFQRLMEPVASRIQETATAQAHAALFTEHTQGQKLLSSITEDNTRFQMMLSSMAEKNTLLQQFHKELFIASHWEEENKRLQTMAASFQVMNEHVYEESPV